MKSKRLRIPTEDVTLSAAEIAVTQTRQFQRLFYLKQLGLAHLVYPAASQTRGAHSIQCVLEATKILRALGVRDDSVEYRQVRMAALLHDIGHIPFSHTLEDEHTILARHDRSDRVENALRPLLAELDPADISLVEAAIPILGAISDNNARGDWRADLVGNTVCADLLAYIATDALWTGIEKRPGYYRIYEYFTIAADRLCIRLTKGGLRNDIVSAVIDLLDMRYALTERVIFHHAKCVASAMLARAARLIRLTDDPMLLRVGDESFLDYLEQRAASASTPEALGAAHILNCLRARRLYQRVFRITRTLRDSWDESRTSGAFCKKWRDGQAVEELLQYVEDAHDLPRGSLVLWCPEGRAGMKLARAQVVWDSAEGVKGPAELRSDPVKSQFPGVHRRVDTIEQQYLDLWTFWVCLDRRFVAHAAAVVDTLQNQIGLACDPVFVETYLKTLPGFAERTDRGKAVRATLQRLQPRVEQSLEQQAALDGVARVDDATILAATRAIADAEIARRADVQRDLFTEPDVDRDSSVSDEGRKR